MRSNLVPHVYDVYLVGQAAVAVVAPHLLPPLEKALALVLDHHVTIYPPSKLHAHWLAGVFSQDPQSNGQYVISHEDGRYACTCPCYMKQTYRFKDRVYCKHIFAAQLYIKAIKAQEKKVPYDAPFQAELINEFEKRHAVQLVR